MPTTMRSPTLLSQPRHPVEPHVTMLAHEPAGDEFVDGGRCQRDLAALTGEIVTRSSVALEMF